MRAAGLAAVAFMLVAAGVAQAQSAATCAFDPATATVTVTLDASPADLEANASTGAIELDGAACDAATVNSTDTVQVNGGFQPPYKKVSLHGTFAPGLTPESSGGSEIEFHFALSGFGDEVVVYMPPDEHLLRLTSDGIDTGNDFDADIFTTGIRVTVNGGIGNDRIDARRYSHSSFLDLKGRAGDDVIFAPVSGGARGARMYGGAGNDTLHGGDLYDLLVGGPGDDLMFGGLGSDDFIQEATADGADDMRGGDAPGDTVHDTGDTVWYSARTNGVVVTIGSSEPDGEPGEGDRVRGDIEVIYVGAGPDVFVGNNRRNFFYGRDGDVELYGGDGDDVLDGGSGADLLVGDDGNDNLYGRLANDFLDGARGADRLIGEGGRDVLHGGGGEDWLEGGDGRDEYFGDSGNDTILNTDGFAENVDCGDGVADDAEADPLDTFVGCEL